MRQSTKRAAAFVHGVDESTEVTPQSQRVYAWKLEYESPDYRAVKFAGTGPDRKFIRSGRGVQIGVVQLDGESDSVIVHAYAPSQTDTGCGAAKGIVVDGAFVTVHELESFAAALSAIVAEARRAHPNMWRQQDAL